MTDFWLRSSFKRYVYTDFSNISLFKYNIYTSFEISSSMDSGVYYDYSFSSSYLNLNGDLSLSSSYTLGGYGDLSFKTGYITSTNIEKDFSISASFNESVFTSFGMIAGLSITAVADIDMESSFSRTRYVEYSIKSLVRKREYSDFPMKSSFLEFPMDHTVSMGMTSYFSRLDTVAYPINTSFDGFILDQVFNIDVLSENLNGINIEFANIKVTFDYVLSEVIVPAGTLSVVTIVDLNDMYQHSGEIVFIKKESLSGVTSSEIEMSYSLGILEDLDSAIIEMKIERDIVDYEDNLGDHISIDLFAKRLDIRKSKSEIVIPFANILYTLDRSDYYDYISVPQKDDFVENSVIMTGFIQSFKVEIETAKFFIQDMSGESITFDSLTGDGNVRTSGLSMTSIALPIGLVKTRMLDQSKFMNYIQITYELIGTESTYNSSMLSTYTEVEGVVSYYISDDISNTVGKSSVTRLANISPSLNNILFVTDSASCVINGIWAINDSIADSVFMDAEYSGDGKVRLFPTLKNSNIDLLPNTFEVGSFSYNKLVDLEDSMAIKISSTMDYFGYNTDLSDAYFKVKPILFYTNNLQDVNFIDRLIYTDKTDLEGITSKESRFTANLMFTGDDLDSSNIGMEIINYDN